MLAVLTALQRRRRPTPEPFGTARIVASVDADLDGFLSILHRLTDLALNIDGTEFILVTVTVEGQAIGKLWQDETEAYDGPEVSVQITASSVVTYL